VIVGRITGPAVSSRKDDGLLGAKLLLAHPVDPVTGTAAGDLLAVADNLGAGPGDVVLITQGSAARFTKPTKDQPIDALVVGIVDSVRIDGTETFAKDAGFRTPSSHATRRSRTKASAT
jgi:ethanolamine utilization protein EutN